MAWSTVRQPNGKYAVFSTVSDGPIMWDVTKEEIETLFVEDAIERARESAARVIKRANGEAFPKPAVQDVSSQVKLWMTNQGKAQDDEDVIDICKVFEIDIPTADVLCVKCYDFRDPETEGRQTDGGFLCKWCEED
jgi:hypothetical protein